MARRCVSVCLPREWEHRELTGRDYGVDMECEVFESGIATGRFVLMQIKGTEADLDEGADWPFDAPVRLIRRAELFAVPLLLCLCPVGSSRPSFRFVWLQEYTRVVLDSGSPRWRENADSVRVRLPRENTLPGSEGRLRFISGYPQRLRASGQLARVQHELRAAARRSSDSRSWQDCANLLEEARGLFMSMAEPGWVWPVEVAIPAIERAQHAVERLHRGPPFGIMAAEDEDHDPSHAAWALLSEIERAADVISGGVAIFHDYRLRRATWQTCGDHDF